MSKKKPQTDPFLVALSEDGKRHRILGHEYVYNWVTKTIVPVQESCSATCCFDPKEI